MSNVVETVNKMCWVHQIKNFSFYIPGAVYVVDDVWQHESDEHDDP